MKKKLLIGILSVLIVLSLFFVIAQNDSNENLGAAGDIGQLTANLTGIGTGLNQDIQIPESLQVPARVIFGVEGNIPMNIFIVLLAVWCILFLLIANILKFIPFVKGGAMKWVGAFLITIIIAIGGAVRALSVFFLNLGNLFGVFEKWPALGIIFAIIIVIALGYGLSIALTFLRRKMELEESYEKGINIARLEKIAETEKEFTS